MLQTPNLATVIPAMDHIKELFNEFEESVDYDGAIQKAICIVRKTLNQYYSLIDSSDMY